MTQSFPSLFILFRELQKLFKKASMVVTIDNTTNCVFAVFGFDFKPQIFFLIRGNTKILA